jgi:hypothetical protein
MKEEELRMSCEDCEEHEEIQASQREEVLVSGARHVSSFFNSPLARKGAQLLPLELKEGLTIMLLTGTSILTPRK